MKYLVGKGIYINESMWLSLTMMALVSILAQLRIWNANGIGW